MLIKESHADVQTTANGKETTMSMNKHQRTLRARVLMIILSKGIFLFAPTLPQYPNA